MFLISIGALQWILLGSWWSNPSQLQGQDDLTHVVSTHFKALPLTFKSLTHLDLISLKWEIGIYLMNSLQKNIFLALHITLPSLWTVTCSNTITIHHNVICPWSSCMFCGLHSFTCPPYYTTKISVSVLSLTDKLGNICLGSLYTGKALKMENGSSSLCLLKGLLSGS